MDIRTHRFPAGATAPATEIRNPSGSVTLEALDGAEEITVEVRALDGAAEQLLDRVEVDLSGSRLRVVVPERRLFRCPSFAVRVVTLPGGDARVAVASADTELRGAQGRVELTGASGDAVVEECRELHVRLASGRVRAGTVHGRATIASASGNIEVTTVGRGVEARTASGDISVGEAAGDVSLGTASGDVSVDRVTGGTVRTKTVSGDVEVGVVPGRRVWLDLSSLSGRMDCQLSEDDAPEADGSAQVSLSLRSVSGDLRIRRAATAG